MTQMRFIDTESLYFDTEICGLLGDRGLHLYIRLWGLADDAGVYDPGYENIALRMGALKFSGQETIEFIQKLIAAGKIISYAAEGKTYHWIKNFQKHQGLHHPSPPRFPLPEWIEVEKKQYPSGKLYAKYTILNDKIPTTVAGVSPECPATRLEGSATDRTVPYRTVPYRTERGPGETRTQPTAVSPPKKVKKKKEFSEDDPPLILARRLLQQILERKPDYKVPTEANIKNWAQEFDYMIRLDKRDKERITQVIDWSQKHHFWANNIVSGGKLREKFDRLEGEMSDENGNKTREPQPQKTVYSGDCIDGTWEFVDGKRNQFYVIKKGQMEFEDQRRKEECEQRPTT